MQDTFGGNLQRVDSVLRKIGCRFLHYSFPLQALILILILLAKNGFGLAPAGGSGVVTAIQEFPRPSGYESASVGPVIVGHFVGIETPQSWLMLSLTGTFVAVVLALLAAYRLESYRRSMVTLVLISASASASLTQHLGNYDWMTYLGAVILALSGKRILAAIGALIMALGNPEQALVATTCLLVLTLSDALRPYRLRAVIALAVSLVVALAVYVWMFSFGIRQSRIGLLPFFLPTALENFLKNPTGNMWTWFGPAWLVVLAALVITTSWRMRIVVLTGCILLPALATVMTADGARVYSLVSLPVLLTLTLWISDQIGSTDKPPSGAVGLYMVIWILTPTLLSTFTWSGTLFGIYLKPPIVNILGGIPPFS